jgi:leucyl/phenylalanyl-tRNA--protein transferase
MFFKKSDASKAALVALCRHLIERDFDFIDCQTYTPHLESLGAKLISRDEFIQRLYKSRLKKLAF